MKKEFDPYQNYLQTKAKLGYVNRLEAPENIYKKNGFVAGLEVHQQLKTEKKLFCKCAAGKYHADDDFDAEVSRRVRPTVSELGEYDGTSLMEFKTKKEIIYRINNASACTYELDDAPPFFINKQALDIALQMSMLFKMSLVGEVHIMRKQYLDGSYSTGFQRTAILGVGGEIKLKNKNLELSQLSIEEDSSREILDKGHLRIFKPDRFGTPLVEIVTKPQLYSPDEVKEACEIISYITRSTDKVNTGMGAARQDVNVSCEGGTRIEIKGVAHISWIPELVHVEMFRQKALLAIKEQLLNRCKNPDKWQIKYAQIDSANFEYNIFKTAKDFNHQVYAVKLPWFKGILSHFTQPGKTFASAIEERMKVVACLEDKFMFHSEEFAPILNEYDSNKIISLLDLDVENDAYLVFWGHEADIKVALETIEERCKLAFQGVPKETRKSFENGTTAFERVLPGADRMYPDTDSAPIPITSSHIECLAQNLPCDINILKHYLKDWNVPEEMHKYLLRKNLVPLIKRIGDDITGSHRVVAMMMAKRLKYVEGHYVKGAEFKYNLIYDLIKFACDNKLECPFMQRMLPVVYEYPNMDFNSVLTTLNFKKYTQTEIFSRIDFVNRKFDENAKNKSVEKRVAWIMGQLRPIAEGNISLNLLHEEILRRVNN